MNDWKTGYSAIFSSSEIYQPGHFERLNFLPLEIASKQHNIHDIPSIETVSSCTPSKIHLLPPKKIRSHSQNSSLPKKHQTSTHHSTKKKMVKTPRAMVFTAPSAPKTWKKKQLSKKKPTQKTTPSGLSSSSWGKNEPPSSLSGSK